MGIRRWGSRTSALEFRVERRTKRPRIYTDKAPRHELESPLEVGLDRVSGTHPLHRTRIPAAPSSARITVCIFIRPKRLRPSCCVGECGAYASTEATTALRQ